MKGSWKRLFAVGGLALALSDCDSTGRPTPSDPFEVRKLPAEIEPYARPVVEANTRFALDLYSELRTSPGNLFFSPFSTSIALAMTYAGAAGITQNEMGEVLHFTELEELHSVLGALIESLDRGGGLGGYQLSIADRVWGQSGAPIRDSYLEIMRTDYQAGYGQIDFVNASEEARVAINDWVKERTAGRIRELFPAGSINDMTRIVLANAIYFKGKWAIQFDPGRTRYGRFSIDSTVTVETPLMYQSGMFRHAQCALAQILEMPYEGGDLSIVILLPYRMQDLGALEGQLTYKNLERWFSGFEEQRIDVVLPRFRLETDYMLPGVLERMGMSTAFTPGADFSNMADQPEWFIHTVVHKAFIEVNEEGTEAAAATGVSIDQPSSPPVFVANHPFVFLIRDHVTGSILFLGRVIDPRG